MNTTRTPAVLPASLLDTDLYKFTMQQAVLEHFPTADSVYRFIHRDKDVYFSKGCFDHLFSAIPYFAGLRISPEQICWLEKTCPYFKHHYLIYLSNYRFKPEQVRAEFEPTAYDPDMGKIAITVKGPWVEAILWEVPLMACLSELYYQMVDRDWNGDGQEEKAYKKGVFLLQANCQISEFGTRRRRSFRTQDLVIESLMRASGDNPETGRFMGTSNVHLAYKHQIVPIGTIAHEWFMGVAAIKGYENANGIALDLWETVYPNAPLIALTDTFSTDSFYKDFVRDIDRARRWTGLRQDSGDPLLYAPRAKEVYDSLGIDYRHKTIIYSDALTLDKVIRLKSQCNEIGFVCAFGIGTFLTNDFNKMTQAGVQSKALNMVIKLAEINGEPCIKISDEMSKNTGDKEIISRVEQLYRMTRQ